MQQLESFEDVAMKTLILPVCDVPKVCDVAGLREAASVTGMHLFDSVKIWSAKTKGGRGQWANSTGSVRLYFDDWSLLRPLPHNMHVPRLSGTLWVISVETSEVGLNRYHDFDKYLKPKAVIAAVTIWQKLYVVEDRMKRTECARSKELYEKLVAARNALPDE